MASESKTSGGSAVAAASGTQRTTVSLHPMALLSIADHHTRMIQGQSPDGSQRALGILVGHQDEEETHIVLAADSLETQEAGKSGFNWTITKEVAQLNTEVYPTYEVLGWYAVCNDGKPTDADFAFHSQMKQLNEAPLFLAVNAAPADLDAMKELPVQLYSSEFQAGQEVWTPVTFKIDAQDAESLTMDAILGAGREKQEADSELNPHLDSTIKAVRIARERMTIVRDYVAAVKAGRVEPDYELLRQACALANQLPAADGTAFQTALTSELVDSQVITMLAALTRAADAANTALDRLGQATQHRAHARIAAGAASYGDF